MGLLSVVLLMGGVASAMRPYVHEELGVEPGVGAEIV